MIFFFFVWIECKTVYVYTSGKEVFQTPFLFWFYHGFLVHAAVSLKKNLAR